MSITNFYDLPQFLVNALARDNYPVHPDKTISVTELIDSPRIASLKRQYPDIEVEAMNMADTLIGNAVHSYIELSNSDSSALFEQRLTAKVGGITITGQVDVIDGTTLYDIKTANVSYGGIRTKWQQQVNIYRWLCEQNGIPITALRVIVFYKGWSKTRLDSSQFYPPTPVEVLNVPLLYDIHEFIDSRVLLHSTENPECSPDDRWERPGEYVVYKGLAKRGKVFHTLAEALDWLKEKSVAAVPIYKELVEHETGYYIYHKPTTWLRCANYCEFNAVCEQYAASARA